MCICVLVQTFTRKWTTTSLNMPRLKQTLFAKEFNNNNNNNNNNNIY